jgi:hypothetical protein
MAIDIAHIKQGLKMPSARDVAFDFDAESDSATFAEVRGKAGHELKDTTTGWSVEGALAPASIATGAVNATGDLTVGAVGSPKATIAAATGNISGDGVLAMGGAAGIVGDLSIGPVGARVATVSGTTGDTAVAGDLDVGPLTAPVFGVVAATGATTCVGDLTVGATGAKTATVTAATGSLSLDGTLAVGSTTNSVGTLTVGPVGTPVAQIDAATGDFWGHDVGLTGSLSVGLTAGTWVPPATATIDATTGAIDTLGDITAGAAGAKTFGVTAATGATTCVGDLSVGATGAKTFTVTAATGAVDAAGAITTDTINEHTSGSGCTVEGVLLKDSNVTTGAAVPKLLALVPSDMAGGDWVTVTTHPGLHLPASMTTELCHGKADGLTVGSIITGWQIGGVCTEVAGVTVTARLHKYTYDTGSIVDAAVGETVTLTKAAGVLSGAHTLASAETVSDNTAYALDIIGTTGVGDDVTICCAHILVKSKI